MSDPSTENFLRSLDAGHATLDHPLVEFVKIGNTETRTTSPGRKRLRMVLFRIRPFACVERQGCTVRCKFSPDGRLELQRQSQHVTIERYRPFHITHEDDRVVYSHVKSPSVPERQVAIAIHQDAATTRKTGYHPGTKGATGKSAPRVCSENARMSFEAYVPIVVKGLDIRWVARRQRWLLWLLLVCLLSVACCSVRCNEGATGRQGAVSARSPARLRRQARRFLTGSLGRDRVPSPQGVVNPGG